MSGVTHLLKANPELALFFCLAAGYAIGKIKIWKIQLGGVCGTLLVALVVGQTGVTLDPGVKSLAFALFIFALGYSAGPQFFANLNRKGLRYLVFPVIEVVAVLTIACLATVTLGLDRGTAAGLLAGGATESAALGTASETLGKLGLPADTVKTLQANVATAYTISYLCGLITIVLFTSQIAPLIMRINLRDSAAALLAKLGGGTADPDSGDSSALPDLVGRLYRVRVADGHTVAQVETDVGGGATIERVRRAGVELPVGPDTALTDGDVALLVGPRPALVRGTGVIGPELPGAEGFTMELDSTDVVFNKRKLANRPLGELKERIPADQRHGVFVTGLTRGEHTIPVADRTLLQNGDVLRLTGDRSAVSRLAGRIGYPIDPTVKADFIYLGAGLVVGILIGQLSVRIGGVPLGLGTGGGALIGGLVFGWLRSKHPTFGAFHPAASQVMKDLGLATFIAATGLASGPQAIKLVKHYGASLPIAGVLMTLIPAAISLFVARRLIKLEPPLALGAVAGQQCSTPAITAIQQGAGNTTPLISYTVVYAVSNVLLPLLGPVIVGLAGPLGS